MHGTPCGAVATILLALTLSWADSRTVLSPFFFLCNYHGNTPDYGVRDGEVIISVQVEGNPQAYIPGEFYQVSISSSQLFDSFLMTGLYTTTANVQGLGTGGAGRTSGSGGQNLMCSIVHSQVSPRPLRTLTFLWSAPPAGTGCINFLATATQGQQLLFKDTVVLQLCEQGANTSQPHPPLAEVNTASVLVRDDFESEDFNPNVWQSVTGARVGDDCGVIVYGKSAVMCNSVGSRELVTVPLNLTSAHVLQFSLGSGTCRSAASKLDPDIVISYGLNACTEWKEIQIIKAATVKPSEVHIVSLPLSARQNNVCLKFTQPTQNPSTAKQLETTSQKSKTQTEAKSTLVTTSVPTTSKKPVFSSRTKKWEALSTSETISTRRQTASSIASTQQTTAPTETSSSTTTTVAAAATTNTTAKASIGLTSTVVLVNDSLVFTTSDDGIYNLTDAVTNELTDVEVTTEFLPSWLVINDEAQSDQAEIFYNNCWAIDNIVIVNTANNPDHLSDTFDPVDPGNWIFFPGAHVESQCQSHSNAFVFEDRNQTSTYAVTRDLNLDIADIEADASFFANFESTELLNLTVDNGHIGIDCGIIHSGNSIVFDGPKKRQLCTGKFDLLDVASVRFYFQFGGLDCQASEKSPAVLVYLEDDKGQTLSVRSLTPDLYLTSQVVSYPIANSTTRGSGGGSKVRLCLLQKSHGGRDRDVWSVDDLALLRLVPELSLRDKDKVLQARVNLECGPGSNSKTSSVGFEYSTDHGSSWHNFYKSCLPSACGGHYQTYSSVFTPADLVGWNRITLPIPYAAQTPSVRFRSVQIPRRVSVPWALDDVFIGSCPGWCSGHGSCVEGGCSCDFGFEGDQCERPVTVLPSSIHETFEDPAVLTSSVLWDVAGGSTGYHCGVVSMGKALVFNQAGPRVLQTTNFNSSLISSFQFTLRIGSQSVTSSCPPSHSNSQNVVLEASCDGGITWNLMEEFSATHFQQPTSVALSLPPHDPPGRVCLLRWRQPRNSGWGQDVWAIDEIHVTAEGSTNLLAVEMMDMPDLGNHLATNLGRLVDSFCDRMRSITFSNKEKNGEARLLKTKDMHVGPGYIAQFDLVMGCRVPYTEGLDNQIYFQYSVDHGISWQLVEEPCFPPDVCQEYTPGTIYHHSEFKDWVTVTVILSPDTWNHQTMFRWMQPDWSDSDVWGINRVYIGHPCPDLCNGHGTCHDGTCRCDKGYNGESCHPEYQADSSIQADFGYRYNATEDFTITGGRVARPHEGCGIILSGESMYFSQNGIRELLTKDLNTEEADFIQFYIRIGGGGKECQGADKRKESVLLRYTVNGGITWHLLDEFHHLEYRSPKFVHLELPDDAKSPQTQFQWWQPSHSGADSDQWAVDEILIGRHRNLSVIQDDFESHAVPTASGQWRLITEGAVGKYCGSDSPSLVMTNQVNDKLAVTNDVNLHPGDVIQFEINVDCGKFFRWDHAVIFQFSHDHGKTWHLVEEPCYLGQDCDDKLTEGSIYYTGTFGQWTLVVIPVTEKIAVHPTIFRWWQPGGVWSSFSIDNLYIGPSCPDHCHRQGLCDQGKCQCLVHLNTSLGDNCQLTNTPPEGMLDRFDNRNMPSMLYWDRILGGHLGRGCGTVDHDNALYFGGEGTREALTVPLNTTLKRILEFSIKIGDNRNSEQCRQPRDRNEGVIVDFSTDNGITWEVLQVVEPSFDDIAPSNVIIQLPQNARQNRTIFRFWQPLGIGDMPRAEWAIDSVLVGVNETSDSGFQDDFEGRNPDPHTWFWADSAIQRETCNSRDKALEFSNTNGLQQAETWDYQVTKSTFLQFDLAMSCGSLPGDGLYSVQLEYSTDHGHTWSPVVHECKPPNFECSGYHLSSSYFSNQFPEWTRVTVALPEGAVSPATRFRWLRPQPESETKIWALDNVYLGDKCPLLCLGHGVCYNDTCHCDQGYGGDSCVLTVPLPMTLKDDFNSETSDKSIWKEIYGGSNSHECGPVVSGRSFTFSQDGLRLAITHDMDTTMLTSLEFYFKYGCGSEAPVWPRNQSVLLQFSTNGGITWKLLKEIHFSNTSVPKFYTLLLPEAAKHNSTRFRFWQAANGGQMRSVWSVDNLFIGTMVMNPGSAVDSFDVDEPDPTAWTFVNDGTVGEYCHQSIRQFMADTGTASLVFRRQEGGELSAISSDLEIGPMSVIQFDINVGCGTEPSSKYPVRLEFSSDGGQSWSLVGPNCAEKTVASCFESQLPKTVYYGGESLSWQRIIVPLDHLHVCGSLRFRWYQGKIPDNDFGPEWALDNVYIGPACMDHCNGHGYCVGGMFCQCDVGYSGSTCVAEESHPVYLKDDFENVDVVIGSKKDFLLPSSLSNTRQVVKQYNWQLWSGGHPTDKHRCGKIFTGASLVQEGQGRRTLTTVPLDLSRASTIQFYLRLGCHKIVNPQSIPVFLQYSTSGGISWTTLEQFDFNAGSNQPMYIAVHIPWEAQTNSTLIRWYQPSKDGTYLEDWAIDQIYIGGNFQGSDLLQDDPGQPLTTSWLEYPGARVESYCGSDGVTLHFKDREPGRYASTADVLVTGGSILQFELAAGCDVLKSKEQDCFDLVVEYSLDMGNSWKLLQDVCLPSMSGCGNYHSSSIFRSDRYTGWHRLTLPLPRHAWSKQTRFRIRQASGTSLSHTWGVQHLYIGTACPNSCSGHGRCSDDQCFCDGHWSGSDCSRSQVSLPSIVVEDFLAGYNQSNWGKLIGGSVTQPCRVVTAGDALHFTGPCSRLFQTKPLNLSAAMLIQFTFLYGCIKNPIKRDEGVILDYSTDGGISWNAVTEMHYNLYRTPTFVSVKIPEAARKDGTILRWWQPAHGKNQDADWLIDGIRVNGEEVNPESVTLNFTSGFEFLDLVTADNMEVGAYCGKEGVAIGRTRPYETSTLSSRDVKVTDQHVLQFSINVACGKPWNYSVQPVHVEYSTDHGMTWTDLVTHCLTETSCQPHSKISAAHYHSLHNNWRRIVIPLVGLPVSNATRFRWQQLPDGMPGSQDWALGDIYIGQSCSRYCSGHGYCVVGQCVCDEDYSGQECQISTPSQVLSQLKDTFDSVNQLNSTKWPWVQNGNVQLPCETLVQGPALVFTGPGARELVTASLDLRDARFVQYTAYMWSKTSNLHPTCSKPTDSKVLSIFLQFSTDGGISWETIHTLSPQRYWPAKRDYIPLPLAARTENALLRWIQAESPLMTSRVHWALDDVYIGGSEINPSEYRQSFDEDEVGDDPVAWEFSPNGSVEGEGGQCVSEGLSGGAMMWPHSARSDSQGPVHKFTTNQMIVQPGYMLQFKMIIGCGKYKDICSAQDSVIKLEFRRNPSTELWEPVQPSCLPGNQNGGLCDPHLHHHASHYELSEFLTWTRVTIPLSEVTFSSSTQFRWIQESHNGTISWALDDIFVGEKCPELCHGRGDCIQGVCHCDQGYHGPSCVPNSSRLPTRLFDTFEGGISPSHWQLLTGGGIGFGCGALLPYAHGKTLYFNGCGERQAVTAELNTQYAVKIIFVIQIGCFAQTHNCNVNLTEGPSYRGVLLQYSSSKGSEWFLIAQHDPADFLKPKRVAYEVPQAAKGVGIQFRWWQPVHDGEGFDQWAIDHVEIISIHRQQRPAKRKS